MFGKFKSSFENKKIRPEQLKTFTDDGLKENNRKETKKTTNEINELLEAKRASGELLGNYNIKKETLAEKNEAENLARKDQPINEKILKKHERFLLPNVAETLKTSPYKEIIYDLSFHPTTQDHSIHMANLAEMLSQELEMDEETSQKLIKSALVHDAGKLRVDSEILDAPRKLTSEERAHVRSHIPEGINILKEHDIPEEIIEIAAGHHPDYPEAEGYNHPLSEVLAMIDIYESLTTDKRTYKEPSPKEFVAKILKEKFTMDNANKERNEKIIAFLLSNYEDPQVKENFQPADNKEDLSKNTQTKIQKSL